MGNHTDPTATDLSATAIPDSATATTAPAATADPVVETTAPAPAVPTIHDDVRAVLTALEAGFAHLVTRVRAKLEGESVEQLTEDALTGVRTAMDTLGRTEAPAAE